VVADQSLDQASRAYLNDMVNSGYFNIIATASDQVGAIRAMMTDGRKSGS